MGNQATTRDDERVIDAPSQACIELASTYLPLIHSHAVALVEDFYSTLLARSEAGRYLDSSAVESRLKVELARWIRNVFSPEAFGDVDAFEERQRQIGEIHARIRIPIHLVNIGAARLSSQISVLVRSADDQPWESRYDAMRFFEGWIDAAINAMTRSGISRIVDRTRLEESYRLFSLDQDMTLERERQRSSLLEWSQTTLYATMRGEGKADFVELADAPFGRWTRHRAEVMFGDAPQLREIKAAVAHVDAVLLPALQHRDLTSRVESLQALRVEVDRILIFLGEIFQGLSEQELGRDVLTRSLNRRFLPSILLREIGFVDRTSANLSGFMLDVDNFKAINDIHGHHAGDLTLRMLAGILDDNVRPTDFVFRYGGEEFFVLLVETDVDESLATAERIRRAVAEAHFTAGGAPISVTVSIGVATHQGHPDPEDLIRRADSALAQAKLEGRNRVVVG